jgi:preprotein translocase subunit SecD
MRKLIYTASVALPLLICCWPVRADTTNALLTFYTVSEEKIDGGRFIDTPAIPKAGYIAAKPDLTITALRDVYPQKSAGFSIMTTNGNHAVVSNTPVRALTIVLSPQDAKRFATLTEQAVGKRLLVMLGDKPLTAPVVRSPIQPGTMVIEFGREFGGQAEAQKVEDDLKKLIGKRQANHSIQRMGAGRSAHSLFGSPWRLAPTADASR